MWTNTRYADTKMKECSMTCYPTTPAVVALALAGFLVATAANAADTTTAKAGLAPAAAAA